MAALGIAFGLEGPFKRRRSMRRLLWAVSLSAGASLAAGFFFVGGGL